MKYPKLRSNQIPSDLMVEPAHLFNRKVIMTKLTCDNAIRNVYFFLFVFGQHSCSLGLPIKNNREKEEKLVYIHIFCLHILVLLILYVFVLANNQYCSSNYTPHADWWNGQHNNNNNTCNNNKSQHCCLCDKFNDGM